MVAFLIGLAINLAIQIGLNVLSRLLQPGRKRQKPAPFEAPTASSGQPLGKGWGIFESQPTVGYVKGGPVTDEPHGDVDVVRYKAKMLLVLGWGPVNILYDIASEERSIGTQEKGDDQSYNDHEDVPPDPYTIGPPLNVDPPLLDVPLPWDFDVHLGNGKEFSINVRQMYGGGGEGGGLQGLLMFYPGTTDQPIDPLVAETDGDLASAYPWTVYARLGAQANRPVGLSVDGLNQQGEVFYLGTSPSPPPISFIMGAYPSALLGNNGRIGINANPVEIIYEIYTDTKWGMAVPVDRIDVAQWTTTAETIRNPENEVPLGISIPRDDPQTADDLIEDILRHIDGGIVEDPITGKLLFKLARPETPTVTIGASNTENLKRGRPLAPKSLNDIQVRYRRFIGAIKGEAVTETTTAKQNHAFGQFTYNVAGDHLIPESIHVYINDVEVLPLDLTGGEWQDGYNHRIWVDSGVFTFILWFPEAQGPQPVPGFYPEPGDTIRIEYAANPVYTAFVDEVATAQNISNQQARGQYQPESYDYPFYTEPLSAQWKADRMRDTYSRTIETFTWEGFRDQSHLTPWDVVSLFEPLWGMVAPVTIRITRVTGGSRTNPRLTFEGVLDLWSEPTLIMLPPGGPKLPPIVRPPPVPAPAMAIGCGLGDDIEGTVRIDLFPTSTQYNVIVFEADDELGTGAIFVATIPAGTVPMFYTGTVGKFYAARQESATTTPGPFTAYITCVDGPPTQECTLPTFTYEADELTGIVVLTIIDPQHRVSLVEYRSRSGNSPWSDWNVSTEPYCFSVILVVDATSRIEWEITYQDCDGSTKILPGGHDFIPFIPPPPPPPVVEEQLQEVEVVLYAGAGAALGSDEIELPAEGTRIPLTPWKSAEVKTPVAWATNAYIAASVLRADLSALEDPSQAYLVIRARAPAEVGAIWQSLGVLDTPRIPLDEAALLLMDDEAEQAGVLPACVAGDWADIRSELLGVPLHLAADIVGVDGSVLQEVIITRLSVWLRKVPTKTDPPEPPQPPPPGPNPGSCDIATPLSMSSGTEEDDGGTATTWSRSSTSADLTISGSASGHSRIRQMVTGLTPDKKYTFYLTVNTHDKAGVHAFLEAVGEESEQAGATSEELEVVGYSDGSGQQELLWGVDNIAGGGGAGTLTIDTEDYQSVGDLTSDGWTEHIEGGAPPTIAFDGAVKESGATAIRFDIAHAAWITGKRYYEKLFSGFPPNAHINSATIRWRHNGKPWYSNPIFVVGVTATGLDGNSIAANTWGDLICNGGEIDDDGNLLVQFGASGGSSVVTNWKLWFDGEIVVDVAGVGDITIDFSDLGYCLGSGKGGDDPENPTPVDPCPTPPCVWPPPPFPLTRWFGIYNGNLEGLGPWTSTVVRFTPKNAVNVLRVCEENDTFVMFTNGPEPDWLVGGVFNESRWRAQMQALYDDAETRNAIIAASTSASPYTKIRVVHQVFDEPFHHSRYGQPISFDVVQRCCIMSKTLFPDLETNLRVDPTDSRYTQKMLGNDTLWGEYSLARGEIDDYIAKRKAKIEALGMTMYMGPHYKHFEGPTGPDPRYITPAEVRYYVRDRMAKLSWIRGLIGWRYDPGLWAQPGFQASIFEARDEFSLSQP